MDKVVFHFRAYIQQDGKTILYIAKELDRSTGRAFWTNRWEVVYRHLDWSAQKRHVAFTEGAASAYAQDVQQVLDRAALAQGWKHYKGKITALHTYAKEIRAGGAIVGTLRPPDEPFRQGLARPTRRELWEAQDKQRKEAEAANIKQRNQAEVERVRIDVAAARSRLQAKEEAAEIRRMNERRRAKGLGPIVAVEKKRA